MQKFIYIYNAAFNAIYSAICLIFLLTYKSIFNTVCTVYLPFTKLARFIFLCIQTIPIHLHCGKYAGVNIAFFLFFHLKLPSDSCSIPSILTATSVFICLTASSLSKIRRSDIFLPCSISIAL